MPPKKTEAQIAKQKAKDQKRKAAERAMFADAKQQYVAQHGDPRALQQQESQAINGVLRDAGLACVQVAGDGDCLFLALLHQRQQWGVPAATRHLPAPTSTLDFRRLVAAYMLANPDRFAPFVLDDDILPPTASSPAAQSAPPVLAPAAAVTPADEPAASPTTEVPSASPAAPVPAADSTLVRYCQRLAASSEQWGGQLELQAAADLYGVTIRVANRHGVEVIVPYNSSASETPSPASAAADPTDPSASASSASSPAAITTTAAPVTWTLVLWEHQFTLGAHYTSTAPIRGKQLQQQPQPVLAAAPPPSAAAPTTITAPPPASPPLAAAPTLGVAAVTAGQQMLLQHQQQQQAVPVGGEGRRSGGCCSGSATRG